MGNTPRGLGLFLSGASEEARQRLSKMNNFAECTHNYVFDESLKQGKKVVKKLMTR